MGHPLLISLANITLLCGVHLNSQLTSEPVIIHSLQFALCYLKFVYCNHLIGLEWFNRDWLDADIALPYTEALVLLGLLLSLLNCFVIFFVYLFCFYLFIYLFILYFHLSCVPHPVQLPVGAQHLVSKLIILDSLLVLLALSTAWICHFLMILTLKRQVF